MNTIELKWEGPFTIKQAMKEDSRSGYGCYAIYGTHFLFGKGSLLYIGKAEKNEFRFRIAAHVETWIHSEPDELQIYFGRLGSTEGTLEITDEQWTTNIDAAERLLIFHCPPPYNTALINYHGVESTLLYNLGKRHQLPHVIASDHRARNARSFNENEWNTFEWNGNKEDK